MFVVWLVGCATYPLADVPILGGTAEQRDAARAVVVFFDDAVGPGRVELGSIHIFDESAHAYAFYRPRSRTIHIRDDTWPIATVLRHELCHALVDQQKLEDPGPDPIDRATDLVVEDESFDVEDAWSEVVAQLCESGPFWAADMKEGGCPWDADRDDRELLVSIAGWMTDHVWEAFTRPEPLAVDDQPLFVVDPAVVAELPERIDATADPDVIAMTLSDGEIVYARVDDGTVVDSDLLPLPQEEFPTGLGAFWYPPGEGAGWADGPAALHGTWDPRPIGSSSIRLMAHDGEVWREVGDGCPTDEMKLFTAHDTVWMATYDWTGLGWAEVVRR